MSQTLELHLVSTAGTFRRQHLCIRLTLMKMVPSRTARRLLTLPRSSPTVSLIFSWSLRESQLMVLVGVHVDSEGRVYAGCGDGVHVWNPSGKLIGKIYTGATAANFQFAGKGRMIITGQTKLFYARLAASGVPI